METISNNLGVWTATGWAPCCRQPPARSAPMSATTKEFARQYLAGEAGARADPQEHPAERRCARARRDPAFTPAGVSTRRRGRPALALPPGRLGRGAVTDQRRSASSTAPPTSSSGLTPDFALVHAWKGDRHGNLVYRRSARSFNPDAAAAGRITIARSSTWRTGRDRPDHVHPTASHVQRVVHVPDADKAGRIQDGALIVALTRDEMAPGSPRSCRQLLRQPRHRHADPGLST
ncbi:succinyl-CoA--3-ketoacid-CoA transferase [Pseudonocardia sp. MCCB 268]|nr:succinyl-CoA--3-ketoacid-CoA transferase [Pseudonocardia cytotoxica]